VVGVRLSGAGEFVSSQFFNSSHQRSELLPSISSFLSKNAKNIEKTAHKNVKWSFKYFWIARKIACKAVASVSG